MEDKEIKILNKCKTCKLKECIGCEITNTEIKQTNNYIEQLKTKVKELEHEKEDMCENYCPKLKELGKGQQTLISSRRKWKRKYYKERRKIKETVRFLEARVKMYEICCETNGIPKSKIIEQEILEMLGEKNERD